MTINVSLLKRGGVSAGVSSAIILSLAASALPAHAAVAPTFTFNVDGELAINGHVAIDSPLSLQVPTVTRDAADTTVDAEELAAALAVVIPELNRLTDGVNFAVTTYTDIYNTVAHVLDLANRIVNDGPLHGDDFRFLQQNIDALIALINLPGLLEQYGELLPAEVQAIAGIIGEISGILDMVAAVIDALNGPLGMLILFPMGISTPITLSGLMSVLENDAVLGLLGSQAALPPEIGDVLDQVMAALDVARGPLGIALDAFAQVPSPEAFAPASALINNLNDSGSSLLAGLQNGAAYTDLTADREALVAAIAAVAPVYTQILAALQSAGAPEYVVEKFQAAFDFGIENLADLHFQPAITPALNAAVQCFFEDIASLPASITGVTVDTRELSIAESAVGAALWNLISTDAELDYETANGWLATAQADLAAAIVELHAPTVAAEAEVARLQAEIIRLTEVVEDRTAAVSAIEAWRDGAELSPAETAILQSAKARAAFEVSHVSVGNNVYRFDAAIDAMINAVVPHTGGIFGGANQTVARTQGRPIIRRQMQELFASTHFQTLADLAGHVFDIPVAELTVPFPIPPVPVGLAPANAIVTAALTANSVANANAATALEAAIAALPLAEQAVLDAKAAVAPGTEAYAALDPQRAAVTSAKEQVAAVAGRAAQEQAEAWLAGDIECFFIVEFTATATGYQTYVQEVRELIASSDIVIEAPEINLPEVVDPGYGGIDVVSAQDFSIFDGAAASVATISGWDSASFTGLYLAGEAFAAGKVELADVDNSVAITLPQAFLWNNIENGIYALEARFAVDALEDEAKETVSVPLELTVAVDAVPHEVAAHFGHWWGYAGHHVIATIDVDSDLFIDLAHEDGTALTQEEGHFEIQSGSTTIALSTDFLRSRHHGVAGNHVDHIINARFLHRPGSAEVVTVPLELTIRDPHFVDAFPGRWDGDNLFHEYVQFLGHSGIAQGWLDQETGVREFRPGNYMTRQAMAAFLYAAAGSPEFTAPETPTFLDVPVTNSHFMQIEWAAAQGITTGWGSIAEGTATFRPGENMNREQMAAFLYRLVHGTNDSGQQFDNVFTDNTGTFARHINWLAAKGISTGWGSIADGTAEYRPSWNIQRDAMAAFIYRMVFEAEVLANVLDAN